MKLARLLAVVGLGSVVLWAYAAQPKSHEPEKLGQTYPIIEKHAIEEIQARLLEKQENGELERLQAEVQERINQAALNLAEVDFLKTAEKGSVRYFEPSYTLPENVYDHEGQIIAVAGSVVKPLEVAPIPFQMLFFDGRDPAQIELAKKLAQQHGEAFMPILTAGRWDIMSAELNQAVYFDQQGRMSKSFQLQEVPSLVSQAGNRLRIEVFKP